MHLRSAFWLFLCGLVLVALCPEKGQAQVWRKLHTAVGFNVGINPLNSNTFYCEGTSGQVWISRDRGLNWSTMGTTVPTSGMRHIFVAPRDTMTVFVVAFSGGLWRTTNEGATWTQVIGGAYGIDGESMDYDKVHPDTMFAGNYSDGSVYRSLDRGVTWTFRGISGPRLCALTVRPDSSNIIFAGTSASTISKSIDYGATWKVVNNGGVQEVPKLVVNPNNPLIAYATTNSNGDPALDSLCSFWKTTDGGETWFKTALQKLANWSAAMDVQHPETLWVGKFGAGVTLSGMTRTTDGGASFKDYNRGIPANFDSWNLRVHPLDPTVVLQAGTINAFGPGGVYRFMDTSATRVQGTVRDSVTHALVKATLTLINVPDSIYQRSTYEFGYYPGDPTLTPTVHIEAPGYYPKDTVLVFVNGTVQTHDILLTPLPFNSINGSVYWDATDNGVKDPGDPLLSGWQINLSGPVSGSTLSDAQGRFFFDSLSTGTYTITETVPAGWVQGATPCGFSYTITFVAGTSVEGEDFGNIEMDPGAQLLFEDFTTPTFPPPCWSIQDINGGLTWHRITSNNHSEPASARVGVGNLGEGKHDDWLFTRPMQLKAGNTYTLSWWERTFVNGAATGIDSLAVAVGTAQNAAGMTHVLSSRGINTSLAYAFVTQSLTVSSDGVYYIGFHDFSADGNTLRIDDVTLTFGSSFATGSISGTKFNDMNDNGIIDGLDVGIQSWKIRLSGDAVDSTLTDINGNYTFFALAPGNYTVSEAAQPGWTQTFPLSGSYSIVLGAGQNLPGRSFGNFHPNTIIVRNFEDADGNLATTGDRTPKPWHLEVQFSTATGPVVVITSGETGNLSVGNLPLDDYAAAAADSAGWIRLGYAIDGVDYASNDSLVEVDVVSGETHTIDFISASPAYSRRMRTASAKGWATAVDKALKPKSVKRKADKVDFKMSLSVSTTAMPVLELKFNMAIEHLTVYSSVAKSDTLPYSALTIDPKRKLWTYTFSPAPVASTTIQVDGRGLTGKLVKASYVWSDPVAATKRKGTVPDLASSFILNVPGLPKPNLNNVGEELFPSGFGQASPYFGAGMLVGVPQGAKLAQSVRLTKYTNLHKSLIVDKTGQMHASLSLTCLDSTDDGKPITKQMSVLPPTKQDNLLFAELVALKLNVASSVMEKFPGGLGELTFVDTALGGNPFNGQMVSDIVTKADSMLSCLTLTSKVPVPTLSDLYDVLHKLNAAFSDSVNDKDTISFAAKTKLTGVRRLIDVPYLRTTPGIAPVIMASPPVVEGLVPSTLLLSQNYPNPFNPTTTIRFALPSMSVVSLKIYNMLGQEVAVLINREVVDEGESEIEFDAGRLPSGVYFYRLVANELSEDGEATVGQPMTNVKKMILVK